MTTSRRSLRDTCTLTVIQNDNIDVNYYRLLGALCNESSRALDMYIEILLQSDHIFIVPWIWDQLRCPILFLEGMCNMNTS